VKYGILESIFLGPYRQKKSAPGYATLHFISVPARLHAKLRTHSFLMVSTILCP